jgi:hypothetical protein
MSPLQWKDTVQVSDTTGASQRATDGKQKKCQNPVPLFKFVLFKRQFIFDTCLRRWVFKCF